MSKRGLYLSEPYRRLLERCIHTWAAGPEDKKVYDEALQVIDKVSAAATAAGLEIRAARMEG
jgi:hypothetical protein